MKTSIKCYLTKIETVKAVDLLNEYLEYFPNEKLDRISQAKSEKAKAEMIYGNVLLALELRKRNVIPEYKFSDNGKPYVLNVPDFFFSISHSGEYVLLATSNVEVGADIQVRRNPLDNLVRKITSESERDKYASLLREHFNLVWAIKEGFSKLTGKGILTSFDRVSFEIDKDKIKIFEDNELKAYAKKVYSDNEYEAVVCAYDTIDECKLEFVKL